MISVSSTHYNHEMIEAIRKKREHLNVMIIGNNPIEITSIYNSLNEYRGKNYIADVCFSIKDSITRMLKKRPDCILLDDNILLDQLKSFVLKLKESSRLKNIPVVLLKSSNLNFAVGNDVQDFLLKGNLTTDILSNTIEKNVKAFKNIWR